VSMSTYVAYKRNKMKYKRSTIRLYQCCCVGFIGGRSLGHSYV